MQVDGNGQGMAAFLAVLAVGALICGFISAMIARSKGIQNTGGYFFIGCVLGIIGIIVAAVAKSPARVAAQPAGWYADPWRQAPHRYWSGQEWTQHVDVAVTPWAQVPPTAPDPQVR